MGDWDGNGFFTVGVVDVVFNPSMPGGPKLLRWELMNSNSAGAPDVMPSAYGHFPHTARAEDRPGGVASLESLTEALSTRTDSPRLTAALDRVFESGDF
jgi:hypothetical protein